MFSWLLCILTTDWLPKGVLSGLFKGCWRISTSQRMQTSYASSPGKAKFPLWASVKASRRCLSWGDSHCRYSWQRVEGGCTWGPGCTGRSWVGCGWMCPPNERWQAPRLCHPPEQCDPGVEECLIRDSHLSQTWAEIWGDAEKREAFYAPHACVIWILCLLQSAFSDLFNIVRFTDLYYVKYLCASLYIFSPYEVQPRLFVLANVPV